MSTDSGTEDSSEDREIEMQHLVAACKDLEEGNSGAQGRGLEKNFGKQPAGPVQQFMFNVDQCWNTKLIMRVWRPRLEFLVRLMLLSTFFDDSLRTATNFSNYTYHVAEESFLGWFMAVFNAPKLIRFIAGFALVLGMIAQLVGSVCLLAVIHCDISTKVLITWVIIHPVLFSQVTNIEFVAESLSLLGGLFMLRAHLVHQLERYGTAARTQLLGRALLPAMYLYYAGEFLFSAFTLDETSSLGAYFASLSMVVVNSLMLVLLIVCCTFVAFGLKSRIVALVLAITNIIFAFYQHPFFLYLTFKNGWFRVRDDIVIPQISLPAEAEITEFDLEMLPIYKYDLHKYHFFMGLSTSGALLLLAQLGPGEIAINKDEVIIPTRALD